MKIEDDGLPSYAAGKDPAGGEGPDGKRLESGICKRGESRHPPFKQVAGLLDRCAFRDWAAGLKLVKKGFKFFAWHISHSTLKSL
jgi:hypothetical protein